MFEFGPSISRLAILSVLSALGGVASTIAGLVAVEMEIWDLGLRIVLTSCAFLGSALGLAFGASSLKSIKHSRGRFVGEKVAVGGISLSCLAFVGFLVSTQFDKLARQIAVKNKNQCEQNLKVLYGALKTYAENHGGRLPKAQNWCGEILAMTHTLQQSPDYNGSLFQCPSSRGFECCYGYNSAVGDQQLESLPPGTPLLFEISSGWNVSGGSDTMLKRERHGGNNVCLADGSIVDQSDPRVQDGW